MKRTGTLLVALFLGVFLGSHCEATVYYSDGSAASVQYLHDNLAQNGDTITLPAGDFTWPRGVVLSKNITLRGAGSDLTIVRATGLNPLSLGTTSSRATGIHFILTSDGSVAMILARGQNFRVDNCTFENGGGSTQQLGVLCTGGSQAGIPHPTGVIDHCTFLNSKFLVQGDLNLVGQFIWNEPSKIGNPDQTGVVYLEDNLFIGTNNRPDCADADFGGRYVFRYNEVHNFGLEVHATRTGAVRGGKSIEIYNNTFIRDVVGDEFYAIWPRGGTAVIFNNTISGVYDEPIVLDNWRSFSPSGYPPGNCDGSSDWDQNQINGWPCRDQIGRGPDAYLWTIAPYPPQPSEPVYAWNNTHDGAPVTPYVHNCVDTIKPGGSCADIVAGRDYVNASRPGYVPYVYPYHRHQAEPGAIRLERRRLYPAERYHDDRFKWSPDYLARFACGFIRCLR